MERVRRTGVKEVNLIEVVQVLLRRLWLILLSGFIVALIVFGLTKTFVAPKYTAETILYVNNTRDSAADNISSSDISASIMLTNTYLTIIQSDTILNEVLEKTESKMPTEEFKEMIRAVNLSDSEVISIQITTKNAKESAKLAANMADVVVDKMPDIVEGSSVKILDQAKVPKKKSSPSYAKRSIVGAFVGCLLAMIVIIILTLTDQHVHSEEDLERWDYPILGVIPDMKAKDRYRYKYYSKKYSKE